MKKNKKILLIIVCMLISLFTVSCGEAESVNTDGNTNADISAYADESEAKWSIYLYMVGSDLEDDYINQLSKVTETLIADEVQEEKEYFEEMDRTRVKNFLGEVSDLGITVPNSLYNIVTDKTETEKNTDPDSLGYASLNLETMLSCDIPEGVQIIVQTGGATRWENPDVNPNYSQIFLIDCDGFTELSAEPVKNMADPETFEEFMVFCKEYFPAENEMLLLWDHGGGYSGFGCDHIFSDDMLTIREMAGAMKNVAPLFSDGEKLFDVIAFDACLMGNLETVRLFRDYADLYLASPETMSGVGWGYEDILNDLNKDPEISPEELGKQIAIANVANVQYEDLENVYPAVYAVIDLNSIENLYKAYSDFMETALKASLEAVGNLAGISSAASNSLSYAGGSCAGYNLIDLKNFMDNLSEKYPEETARVEDALNKCILYKEATSYFKGTGGMSVFFPVKMTGLKSIRKYLTYTLDISDNPTLDALFYYKITGYLNDRLMDYVGDEGFGEVSWIDYSVMEEVSYATPELKGDGNMSMEIPEDSESLIQDISFGLVFEDEETGTTVYLQELDKVNVTSDGTVSTDFNLTWPSLGINELPAEKIGEDSDKITYRVPVIYYGSKFYLIFYKEKKSGEYVIAGFADGMDNGSGLSPRTVFMPEEGETFYVEYQSGYIGSKLEDSSFGEYTWSKDMKIVDKVLSDGMYIEYFRFDDLRSDIYYSPMVVLEVRDGVVVNQYVDWNINAFDVGDNS